jgi:hypothetical protein
MLGKTVGGREDTLMAKVSAITRKYYIRGSWCTGDMGDNTSFVYSACKGHACTT